jgi:hypothetical protein
MDTEETKKKKKQRPAPAAEELPVVVEEEEDADIIHKEIWAPGNNGNSKKGNKQMSQIEMFAQSFVLLIAGLGVRISN